MTHSTSGVPPVATMERLSQIRFSTDGLVSIVPGGASGGTRGLTLMLGNSQSTINVAGTTLSNNAQLSITAAIVDGGSSSALNLNLNTTGIITLGGTNTYSGGTNVSGGTLVASFTGATSGTKSSTGSGAVSLNGTTLSSASGAVTSYIAGNVNLSTGTNSITPGGTGFGTLDIGGNLTFASGTTDSLVFNVNGSAFSSINVAGAATFTVDPTVSLGTSKPTVGTSSPYILLAVAGGGLTIGDFTTTPVPFFNWAISSNGQDLELVSATGPAITWAPTGGAATGTWDINTTANWVPTGGSGQTKYADTDVVTFGDINAALTGTVNIPATVTPAIVTFANTGNGTVTNTTAYTLTGAGAIAGSGTAVNITGGGLVVFDNSSNTYSGTTTISPGTLRAGAANVFSPNSVVALSNAAGALLDLGGYNQTISNLAGGGTTGGNVALGGATLTVGDSTNQTFGGVIGDVVSGGIVTTPAQGGSLIKTGSGTLTLGAVETYQGNTTISAGVISLVSVGTLPAGALLPSTTTLILGTTATAEFQVNGQSQTIAGLSGGNSSFGQVSINAAGGTPVLTINQSANTTYAGKITGSGSLVKTGSGSLTLSGANTYGNPGGTTISAGTLVAAYTAGAVHRHKLNRRFYGTGDPLCRNTRQRR